ncbi:MAG TPA: TonB-dependent receptor [Caulobacteraceae bacterium]|nr:TonB-dependent receptor [Caulobacteraceae bacterium]
MSIVKGQGALRPTGRAAALLASTILASAAPGLAHAATAAAAATGVSTTIGEIVVTAEKRAENVQAVPMSIQVMDSRTLTKLNVVNFEDYTKFLPSVTFLTYAPNQTTVYIRGVSDGGNAIHSGPQPVVGMYLDEQPITTIDGNLDVHVYDMARIEVLEGPQGTLYGASSEAGTIRLITNQPNPAHFAAGWDLTGDYVDHGNAGYIAEGFVNVPITNNVAVRLVGFAERDPGYIDNVYGQRTYATTGNTINNAAFVKKNINTDTQYGGRIALRWDVNENWSITPMVMAQHLNAPGVPSFEPSVGDLKVNRFAPDEWKDDWVQAALTIQGKIHDFTLTYSGGYFNRRVNSISDYTDYSVAYDAYYGSGAYWVDNNNNPLLNPQEIIYGRDRYEKESNELRIASPDNWRFRFVAGVFQERQTHWIIQDYIMPGFSTFYSVTGWPQTIWLTDQNRIDRDEAAYVDANFDITPQLTLSGGVRYYHYRNSLFGFYGYSANYSSHTGEVNCIAGLSFRNAPCVDLDKPDATASGEVHRVNLQYKFNPDALVYFQYATGFRPGGINRSGVFPPYGAETLTSYEVGWKTSWLDRSLIFNGALYDEEWSNFQFSFLGPNSLTIIANAPSARIYGAETTVDWRVTPQFTLSGSANYNHAVLTGNFCGTDQATGQFIPTCPDSAAEAVHGQPLPYVPKFKGNLTGRYTFPFMGWDAHAQASVVYQTMTYPALRTGDWQVLGTMPGYATVDFAVGADRGPFSWELYVKNAFDERGEANRNTPCTTSVCAPAYPALNDPAATYVLPIRPLTVGLRIGEKF